jgi:hypothetical protein
MLAPQNGKLTKHQAYRLGGWEAPDAVGAR